MRLVAFAFAAAPCHIWAFFTFGGHGVTAGYLGGVALVGFALRRMGRGAPIARRIVAGLLVLTAWGVIVGLFQPGGGDLAERGLRHATLFVFSVMVLLGAASVRFTWREFSRVVPPILAVYGITVAYGLYQAIARRYDLPFAFLQVHNPTLSTDESGAQAAATVAMSVAYRARASSFFVEPTNYGMYLGYGVGISFALVEMGGRLGKWGNAGLALSALGFASNQSLTGMLACGTAVLLNGARLALGGRAKRVVTLVGVLAAAIAGLMALPGALAELTVRLTGLSIEQSSGRYTALGDVLEAVSESPQGLGMAGHVTLGSVHNGALVFLAQFGFLGALIPATWIVLVVLGWRRSLRATRNGDREVAAALALSSSLLANQVCIWLSSGIINELMFWSMSGLALAAGYAARMNGLQSQSGMVPADVRRATFRQVGSMGVKR
jgi:hypothetical protein